MHKHPLLRHVGAQRLKDYLDRKGWKQIPFGRDTVLKFASPSNQNLHVLVPSRRELVDYDRIIEIAIEVISGYENRYFDAVLSETLPQAIVECEEIGGLVAECERLATKHRDVFALEHSLKYLRVREQMLKDEIASEQKVDLV